MKDGKVVEEILDDSSEEKETVKNYDTTKLNIIP